MNPKLLLSKRDAAQMLSVSLRTIDNLIVSKQLSVKRIGRRTLIHERELRRLAERSFIDTRPAADGGLDGGSRA